MTKKMLKFVSLDQETPIKREKTSRKEDFNEIYKEYIEAKLKNNPADVLNAEFLFAKYIVL